MSHYEITEKTGYSGAWVFLFLLFIAGIVLWLLGWTKVALAIAVAGFIIAAYFRFKGKKKVGGHLELTDNGIIFWEDEEARCVAFNEIKYVKFSSFLGEEAYLIETTVGNKRTLKPQDYENSDQLKERLKQKFEAFDCFQTD